MSSSNRPKFDDIKDKRRQKQLIKNTIQLMTAATGVFVVRLSASDIKRIRSVAHDENDPLKMLLDKKNLNRTFQKCKNAHIDIASSIEAIVEMHDTDSTSASSFVFLAYGVDPKTRVPVVKGIMTCSRFVSSDMFTTSEADIEPSNYTTLGPYFGKNLLIDTVCSLEKGVGRVLILHAYDVAHRKGFDGVIALSYSNKPISDSNRPASESTFLSLGFTRLIDNAKFASNYDDMFGHWFHKPTHSAEGLNQMLLALCTRSGLKGKAAESLIWRCPV